MSKDQAKKIKAVAVRKAALTEAARKSAFAKARETLDALEESPDDASLRVQFQRAAKELGDLLRSR